MRTLFSLILRLLLCALPATLPLAALGDAEFQGHTVISRAGEASGAVVIWDCTPEIVAIVQTKLSDQAANDKLERDGLKALASELGSLSKSSKTVTLRIIYAKTGDVNPEYKAATFTGLERYATITMSGKDAFTNRGKWQRLHSDAALPDWIHFKVTGALPPR